MTKSVIRMHLSRMLGTVLSLGCCTSKTLGFAPFGRLPYARISKHATAAAATAVSMAITPHITGSNARLQSSALCFSSSSRASDGISSPLGWTCTTRGGGSGGSSQSLSTVSSAVSTAEPVAKEGGGGAIDQKPAVIFVLGGPGSGKGTQCQRLAAEYGYVHLSAGELLRQERESGSKDGQLIDEYIKEGRIVPVAISLGLLQRAMKKSGPYARFLIDGFPRNQDNVEGWNAMMADVAEVRCVLFLHCPEEVLEQRLLARGESSGRTDDNAETARRRFKTYVETTLPVVEQFDRQGMVARVNGDQAIDAVFRDVRAGLRSVHEKEVVDAHRVAVEALSRGDHKTYAEMCIPDMTTVAGAGRPNDARSENGDRAARVPFKAAESTVRMLTGAAAVVFSERGNPHNEGSDGALLGAATWQETRVWEVREGRWKCVHCHASSQGPQR